MSRANVQYEHITAPRIGGAEATMNLQHPGEELAQFAAGLTFEQTPDTPKAVKDTICNFLVQIANNSIVSYCSIKQKAINTSITLCIVN